MKPLKYISLFSGIEAATVAWQPLGWEAQAYSEIDPFPKAVLAHHYPDVPDLGDITKVDWRKYRGTVDLVCGGSPCQAFSVAGLRKALDDPRGRLMLEYLRACHEIDPEWIVWENVPGVLSADGGRAFGSLLAGVAELWPDGGAAWRVLDAQFYGVAQRRRRVFLVVNTRDWRRAAPVLFERESLHWDYPSSREKRKALTSRLDASSPTTVSSISYNPRGGIFQFPQDPTLVQTLTAIMGSGDNNVPPIYCGHEPVAIAGNIINRQPRNGGNGLGYETDGAMYTLTATDRHAVWCTGDSDADAFSLRRLTPVEFERLQGFPDGYTDVPWRGGEHSPDYKRYKALGNSMAVPVMHWIGEGIELVNNSQL